MKKEPVHETGECASQAERLSVLRDLIENASRVAQQTLLREPDFRMNQKEASRACGMIKLFLQRFPDGDHSKFIDWRQCRGCDPLGKHEMIASVYAFRQMCILPAFKEKWTLANDETRHK